MATIINRNPARQIGCCLIWLAAVCTSLNAAELTEEQFRKLHADLQPKPSDLWRTIPWKTSLLDAQKVAVAEKKPLFIWAMDGHPLGCT